MKGAPLVCSFLLCSVASAATVDTYALLTANGRRGTMTVTTQGAAIDVDWRVDNNGRGPKIREHIVMGSAGLPVLREISGTAETGAPVKETFSVEKGRARWTSLDDSGEAEAGAAIYLDNRGSPWSLVHELRVLLATKGLTRAALPAGTVRLEKIRTVTVGTKKERLDAYAIWGIGLSPELVLARGNHLVADINPYAVIVEEGFPGSFAALTALARALSVELLSRVSARLTHRVDGPVWITHARLFDPLTGSSTRARTWSCTTGGWWASGATLRPPERR